ncbi:OmpA family protein [Flavobacterium luminosum]|uniref:OmpA family protein n=1 Tax=Flavobacterium luminosum TaxID=2949086 RepID=A0ABT0TLW4_9FLAO|nr:OmpA family protein [Flavobacterium sp. HXWNR70]MCL9808375.1 OmpA family protein [Flavobacterium sp. HXWNR70]
MIRLFFILCFVSSLSAQEQFNIYFQSNKHTLSAPDNKELLQWVENNKNSKILAITGYTDEDGTQQYNDSLAAKRVETVFKLISGKVPIREDFKKISFGEKHQHSKIKAENRKVIIYYLLNKDLHREAEVLGIKPESVPKKKIAFPDKVIITNPNGSKSEYQLDVDFMNSLSNASKGTKLKLNNLNFVLNTFAVTNDSRGKLYELLLVMQQNPSMKIDIQGHICCVKSDKQELSTQRAKAVYKFLELNGIEKNRMSYQGFGSTQPLFPLPEKSEEERAANRRVEIEIINN